MELVFMFCFFFHFSFYNIIQILWPWLRGWRGNLSWLGYFYCFFFKNFLFNFMPQHLLLRILLHCFIRFAFYAGQSWPHYHDHVSRRLKVVDFSIFFLILSFNIFLKVGLHVFPPSLSFLRGYFNLVSIVSGLAG